jgi:nucleoside-triphosphatase THEP1
MGKAARLILTGESGCGKTRTCRMVADGLRARGWTIAGVLSPGVWWAGERVAIDALDLRSGEVRRLAERREGEGEAMGPATAGWLFRADTLSWCNALLQNVGTADLLIIDELGPLELERGQGLMQGVLAADAGRFGIGLLVVRPRLLTAAQTRWPDSTILAIDDRTEAEAQSAALLDVVVALRDRGQQAGSP